MNEDELKAKAREMAEILFEHHEPEAKAFIMEHFRVDIEERVKAFHAETGEWPAFRRDPYGRGLTMGTQAEIAQLPRVEVSRKTPAAEQRTRTASLLPRGIPLSRVCVGRYVDAQSGTAFSK